MDMVEIICPACNGTGKVSACIPVPSTPASEGMLTEDLEEDIAFHIKMVLEGVASCLSHFEKVDYQKVAEVAAIDILAKCRQSEKDHWIVSDSYASLGDSQQSDSAEIAELRALFFKANEKIAELDEQLSEAKAEAIKKQLRG